MQLHFVKTGPANLEEALSLRLAPGQEGFVESVAQCLEEAGRCRRWRPVCIYDGALMVGFCMYGRFRWESFPRGRVWLDRFFIDGRFQGRGYGTCALKGLMDRLRDEYRCNRVYLSVVKQNEKAAALYERFGFRFTGETDPNGERIMTFDFPR